MTGDALRPPTAPPPPFPPPAATPVPPPRPRRPRRRPDWRSRLRWFAAEFLVVVSGVLVALLVDSWWADRQAAAREVQVLERLHEEAESVVRYFRQTLALHDTLISFHEETVAALAPGAAVQLDPERLRQGVFFAFTYPAIAPPRSAFDEVTQSGLFAQLSSVDVRAAISDYYGALAGLQSTLAFFRQTAQPGIELTMTLPFAYDSTAPQRMRVLADLATLRRDPRHANALIFGLRNQVAFQGVRRRLYERGVVMCETLAAALDRACEAAASGSPVPR